MPGSTRQRVLVTDGEQRSALAVVRSLGAAGHEVHVAARGRRSLAGCSRHTVAQHVVPDPLTDPAGCVAAVRAAVERHGITAVVPITEGALHALLPARAELQNVLIPWPEAPIFDAICDKARVLEVARELGIATPTGRRVASREEALADGGRAAAEGLRFPVVIKPSRSVRVLANGRSKHAVVHAADAAQLARRLAELPDAAFPLLIQERIVGPGTGVFLLRWDGEVVARFAHRRIREKPPAGGVSTFCESVPIDEALVARATALLARFGWNGVAMVEFKRDARSGVPRLMEINARFWGSLQLAIDSGVDFPRLLLEAASGAAPEPVRDYRVGVRSRWWWGDVDHLITRVRHSDAWLALPPGAPTRWATVRAFVRAGLPHRTGDVLRPDDLRPFLHETGNWLRGR